jgi:hypothetical protein
MERFSFPDNFFFRKYFEFIKRPQNLENYHEYHHIYPVSTFGEKDNNLVVPLEMRNHVIAHYILYRGYEIEQDGMNSFKNAKAVYRMLNIRREDLTHKEISKKFKETVFKKTSIVMPKEKREIQSEATSKFFASAAGEVLKKQFADQYTGVPISEDHKNSISKTMIKKHEEDPEYRFRTACYGEKNGFYGKTFEEVLGEEKAKEVKKKQREYRMSVSEYNNGSDSKYFKKGEQPEGWILGRLVSEKQLENSKKLGERLAGKHWYNNGEKQSMFNEGEQPLDWKRGIIPRKRRTKKEMKND